MYYIYDWDGGGWVSIGYSTIEEARAAMEYLINDYKRRGETCDFDIFKLIT